MEKSSSRKLETLKLLTMDWELNSCAGTQTHSKSSLGLKPTWVGLKPSQISVWESNPHGWDSNPVKTRITWFQELMKLRFLMFHHQNNSARD